MEKREERNAKALRPTLWRTCRTLANRTRLELFRVVLSNPGMSVAGIAARLKMDQAFTSKYLRELNARGLLLVTRHGCNVFYRVGVDQSVPQANTLVSVLTCIFQKEKKPIDLVFRKVTAFTHPRRVAIAEFLHQGPAAFSLLRSKLGISTPALQRHLHKLASRGFLESHTARGVYALIENGSPFEMALLNLTTD